MLAVICATKVLNLKMAAHTAKLVPKPLYSVTMPAMKNMAGNFFLVGLMGAGKTTLGRQLAQRLGYAFFDSDHVICERTGVRIPIIFELEGEAGFRARETAVIDELTQQNNIVLATGGGAVLQEVNRQALHHRGTVIYLHALPELLLARTRHDKNRPLLQVADPLAKLSELYHQRDPIYRATAHIVVNVTEQHSQQLLQQLLRQIENDFPHAHAHR